MAGLYDALVEGAKIAIVPVTGPLVTRGGNMEAKPSACDEPVDNSEEGGNMEEAESNFKKLVATLKARGGVKDPEALAAWIGDKKYGVKGMAAKAAKARAAK